jgi:hypothetical protein
MTWAEWVCWLWDTVVWGIERRAIGTDCRTCWSVGRLAVAADANARNPPLHLVR